MFALREEHLSAFQPQMVAIFEETAVEDLRENLPMETADYSDDQLKERIRSCRPRAAQFGLIQNTEFMYFVMATLLLGELFWAEPENDWAQTLLQSRDLEPEEKALHVFALAKMASHAAPRNRAATPSGE